MHLVTLPDGKTYILQRLLSSANYKQQLGKGYRSVGLTLTPMATGRTGRNLCPHATRGCSAACFAGYGRMKWPKNKKVAVARTALLVNEPERFIEILSDEIGTEARSAERDNQT